MAAEQGVVDDVEEDVLAEVTTAADDKDVDKGSWLHKTGQRGLIRDHDYLSHERRLWIQRKRGTYVLNGLFCRGI